MYLYDPVELHFLFMQLIISRSSDIIIIFSRCCKLLLQEAVLTVKQTDLMAKSGMNIITRTYRGHVGKQIVIKWYDGKSVISKMPEFTKPWSAAQTSTGKV